MLLRKKLQALMQSESVDVGIDLVSCSLLRRSQAINIHSQG